jgi:hypothetical protein
VVHIRPEDLPHERLSGGPVAADVQNILLRQPMMPAVVFLEGIDLSGDASDGRQVSQELNRLQQVAAHYHAALVGSTGCPKQKPKDRYVTMRDQIIGSTVWGRKRETIIILQREGGDDMAAMTVMTHLPRNGQNEQFNLVWEKRTLQSAPPEEKPAIAESTTSQALLDRVADQGRFTRAQPKA